MLALVISDAHSGLIAAPRRELAALQSAFYAKYSSLQ